MIMSPSMVVHLLSSGILIRYRQLGEQNYLLVGKFSLFCQSFVTEQEV